MFRREEVTERDLSCNQQIKRTEDLRSRLLNINLTFLKSENVFFVSSLLLNHVRYILRLCESIFHLLHVSITVLSLNYLFSVLSIIFTPLSAFQLHFYLVDLLSLLFYSARLYFIFQLTELDPRFGSYVRTDFMVF